MLGEKASHSIFRQQRLLIRHDLRMTSEDCSRIHGFERYQKHWKSFPPSALLLPALALDAYCATRALLVQHMGVENACLDYAMSLDLHKQTIVAGLRKTIGK